MRHYDGFTLLVGAISFGAAAATRIFGTRLRKARKRHLATHSPKCEIANAVAGKRILISGRVQKLEGVLNAPLTDKACVAYHASIASLVRRRRQTVLQKVFDETEVRDFLVRDQSGVAMVRPDKRSLLLVEDNPEPLGGERYSVLLEQVTQIEGQSGQDDSEWKEGALHEGDECVVVGRGTWVEDTHNVSGSADYRTAAKLLVIEAEVISDDPKLL